MIGEGVGIAMSVAVPVAMSVAVPVDTGGDGVGDKAEKSELKERSVTS